MVEFFLFLSKMFAVRLQNCLEIFMYLSKPDHLIQPKGQLISKCLLGVIVLTKKNNEFFLRNSALASKKR